MSFFDIVLDFILMDAFEDLENPPSSVLAVLRNRWLSDSFKETVSYLLRAQAATAREKLALFSCIFSLEMPPFPETLSNSLLAHVNRLEESLPSFEGIWLLPINRCLQRLLAVMVWRC